MKTKISLCVGYALLLMASSVMATPPGDVDFGYHRVEQDGAWTTYTGDSSHDNNRTSFLVILPEDFPRDDIDQFVTKINTDYQSLYDHESDNWRWYDTVQNQWRRSLDVAGYWYGSWNYRAVEDGSIENDDYSMAEPYVKCYWGFTSPGTQYTFEVINYYYLP